MKLKKIFGENFLTFEKIEYDFVNRPLMIQGLNLTDDGQKSNGSGKSSLQSLIEYSITGSTSRGVRDIEIVRFGCKKSNIKLYVDCEVRKEELCIEWEIKLKDSNILKLNKRKYNKGWEEVSFSNVNDGLKYIQQWFAISKEDLFNYFIINKTRFKSFFKSSNKEKVELINRFSDASVIDGIEEVDDKVLQTKYEELSGNIKKTEGKIEVFEEELEKELNRDIDSEYNTKVEELKQDNLDIDEEIVEINSEIETQKQSIKNIGGEIIVLEQNVSTKKKDKQKLKKKIDNLTESFQKINDSLVLAQNAVDKFIATDFELKRKTFKDIIKDIKDKITTKEQDLQKSKNNEEQVLKILSALSVQLSGTISCPSCKHEFIQGGEFSLEELKQKESKALILKGSIIKSKGNIENEIEILNLSIKKPKDSISGVDKLEEQEIEGKNNLLNKVNEINGLINTKNQELSSLKTQHQQIIDSINIFNTSILNKGNSIKEYEQEIKNLESEIENYGKEKIANDNLLNSLKKVDNKNEINEIKGNISTLENEIKTIEKELKETEDEIYKLTQWKNNFKQFKNHVANKSLEIMEFNANRFLKGMGSDLIVKYDGYKTLANGTIKDDITATIIRGVERTFGSFSGGEQAKLIFASILSNRHLINSSHPFGGLGFLSIDEVFESLDSEGFKALFEEIKTLQTNIMLITHVTFDDAGEDILTVIKENGISKIQ